jgi:hypothetical protein
MGDAVNSLPPRPLSRHQVKSKCSIAKRTSWLVSSLTGLLRTFA